MKKKKGAMIIQSTVIYTITLIMVMIVYVLTNSVIIDAAEMSSDDLVSSELAVYKDIDMEELGKSDELRKIIISDYTTAFDTFKKYLSINYNLDENLKPKDKYNFIKSQVRIEEFIIYNVYKDSVQTIRYTGNSTINENKFEDSGFVENSKGQVLSPQDNIIENTTIYARISFDIKSIFNKEERVSLEQETDVLKE